MLWIDFPYLFFPHDGNVILRLQWWRVPDADRGNLQSRLCVGDAKTWWQEQSWQVTWKWTGGVGKYHQLQWWGRGGNSILVFRLEDFHELHGADSRNVAMPCEMRSSKQRNSPDFRHKQCLSLAYISSTGSEGKIHCNPLQSLAQ